jgi:drug/metabolite transporter (DMT)-like permease
MYQGLFYALIALFSWGIHGPAGRYLALQGVNMYLVFALRFWIGALVFFIYLFYKKSLNLQWKENFKQVFLISFIGVFGNSLVYHLALKYLPGTFVMILENLSPVFVLFASFYYLKIKANLMEIVSLIISFIGIGLIISGKNAFPELHLHYYKGIILGILTGITFGYYTFFSGQFVKPYRNEPIRIIQFLLKVFIISAIMALPFILFSPTYPKKPLQIFWIAEMGIFQSGVSYLFWNYALARLKTNIVSILFLLTILFTTINEVLFKLHLNYTLVSGALLICLSGYIISKQKIN